MRGAIVRQIDELGRVVIPAEIRSTFGISDGAALEFFLDGETILLSVYRPGCALCGETEETRDVRGRPVCRKCAAEAARVFGEVAADSGPAGVRRGRPVADGRLEVTERAALEWVEGQLRMKGWQVDSSGRAGKSVDLVAWTETRAWYIQVKTYEGDEPEWPSGHQLGWLKGAARRKDATAVVAFVRAVEPSWTVEFWSAHAQRRLGA